MKRRDTGFNWEDFEKEALEKLQKGEKLEGKNGILAPMLKKLLERALKVNGRSLTRNKGK